MRLQDACDHSCHQHCPAADLLEGEAPQNLETGSELQTLGLLMELSRARPTRACGRLVPGMSTASFSLQRSRDVSSLRLHAARQGARCRPQRPRRTTY